MHVVDALRRFGGTASRSQLLQLVDRGAIERALGAGVVVRDARGAYALPTASVALRAAAAHRGTVSHLSAAAAWGWKVWGCRGGAWRAWLSQLAAACGPAAGAPQMAEGHPLARSSLARRARPSPPPSAARLWPTAYRPLTTAVHSRARALPTGCGSDNPFESVLRWIATGVRGLDVVPQVTISERGYECCPDLVDVKRRIVLEAESATWHTSRAALKKDCRRYNRLTLLGWLVLRFVWEDVMFDADYVRSELIEAAAERAQPSRWRRKTA